MTAAQAAFLTATVRLLRGFASALEQYVKASHHA